MSLAFCPQLDEIYRSRRTVGQTGKVFDQVGALSTVNNLLVLRQLMMERRPLRTLEIGMSFGGSALTMAASHRDLQHAADRPHIAIDPYQSTVWDNCAVTSLATAELSGYVEVHEKPSAIALASLVAAGQRFGVIYVDGSHLFEDVFVDAYFGFRLLADDGVMLFDDCTDPHVAKVLKFLTTNWNGWTEEVDLSPYKQDSQSLRYKIARQLGMTQLRAFRRTAAEPREWDSRLKNF